jgi:predicted nucleic acid-binding protein
LPVALAWCFPDETSEYADGVLVALEGHSIFVPAVWALEVANAILVAEHAKRLRQKEIESFTGLLEHLSITQDAQSIADNILSVLPVARAHGLSAYDAAYLELSIRRGAPLATLDGKLRKAAKASAVQLFLP